MRSKDDTFKIIVTAAGIGLITVCSGTTVAQEMKPAVEESFGGGEATLDWQPYPPFGNGTLEALDADDAPDGDGGIGVLRHPGEGEASVSHVETVKAEGSFEVEASIYCPAEAEDRMGSLTGIAFYLPTGDDKPAAEGQGFYRLVCDYRFGDAGISLAYIGANIEQRPLEMEYWPLEAMAFGGEAMQDWTRINASVERGAIDVYIEGDKLTEQPLAAERVIADITNVDAGYVGIYAGHMSAGSPAEARVDALTVRLP